MANVAREAVRAVPAWVKVQGVALLLLVSVLLGMASGSINLSMFGFRHGPAGQHGGAHSLGVQR